MYCENCGKPIPNGANVCPNCGNVIRNEYTRETSPNRNYVSNVPPMPQNSPQPQKPKKKKGKGCLTAILIAFAVIIIFFVIIIIASPDEPSNEPANDTTTVQEQKDEKKTEKNKAYSIGQKVIIHSNRGDYSLKITGVHETSDRNELWDEKPNRVVIIDYEYENISFDSDVVISYIYFRTYDKDGNVLSVYPSIETKNSMNISQGKKAQASVAYGLNSNEDFITLDFYNITMEHMQKSECTFKLKW